MTYQAETTPAVKATLIPESERMNALPTFFGVRHMLMVEQATYGSLSDMCHAYNGGLWDFYALSNGGFYMAPATDQAFRLVVPGNGFDGSMSADAAGVVASLVGINRALWASGSEVLNSRFYQLREFALDHPENAQIFAAID
ncbi:antirestriction protein (plasmid) [Marinobacter nanhaiticus D15-8W]|uniref:Antirestriction protein n=1 Tax=Marinobacter nanhaiticus D15-8W TaxID=626887 RepID=N6W3L4_9GAMM|nr:antirestriction protein [Marinobacter nanhaiticus]ENO17130.1 antirestriction protein [Marinobacter nanhaiticus D15-8W]BES73858.1 antirestriction protein [Marinobacter nanhaiticus D15-8W]